VVFHGRFPFIVKIIMSAADFNPDNSSSSLWQAWSDAFAKSAFEHTRPIELTHEGIVKVTLSISASGS
jgi:hypothetical protein